MRMGTTLMVLTLIDNGQEYFEVDSEDENDYDVDKDDGAYNEHSDEKWKAFLHYHEHYNHSLSIVHCVMTNKN